MQKVFHLLIIGHGIYNIIVVPYNHNKKTTTVNMLDITTLHIYLHKAYTTWSILFSYYQEFYNDKPLYAYQMNQINFFELSQICVHEPDILPLMKNLYHKNNNIYNYEPILTCLETKLAQINHKIIEMLSLQS